jgi:hypothetical protein
VKKILSKFQTVLLNDDAVSIITETVAKMMESPNCDSAMINDELRRIGESVIEDLNNAIESALRANNLPSNWARYLNIK